MINRGAFLMIFVPSLYGDVQAWQRHPLLQPRSSWMTLLHYARNSDTIGESSKEQVDCYGVEFHPLDDVEVSIPERTEESPEGASFASSPHSTRVLKTASSAEWEFFLSRLRSQDGSCTEDTSSRGDQPLVVENAVEKSLLRNWMAQQRRRFMKTIGVLDNGNSSNQEVDYLTRVEKEELDSAGFRWGSLQPPSLTNDVIFSNEFQRGVRTLYKDWNWTPFFLRLVRYKEKNGDTNVPLDGDDELGRWVALQRAQRWDMQSRRREKLDQIQFSWEASESPSNESLS